MDHYFTIENTSVAEFKDRGSRFIAYAYPLKDTAAFKKILQSLKKEHPKAVHHCFAYRLGYTGDQFRASDDGEPSGTAGKPILGQIDSKKLTDTAIVVVRYFGGSLLGVPGLINAYKTASFIALDSLAVVQKPILTLYDLRFDYPVINEIMNIVKQTDCQIVEQDIQLFSTMKIGIPVNRAGEAVSKLTAVRNVELKRIL